MTCRQVQRERTGNRCLSYTAFSDNEGQFGHMEIVDKVDKNRRNRNIANSLVCFKAGLGEAKLGN